MKHSDRIQAFVTEIWSWYAVHKRTLPWRDLDISDPTERGYRILVSEIMLQQTQVPRVIVTYRNFLETFPTLRDLADASNKEVLMAWRGMGYNSRALRLRDAARTIVRASNSRLLVNSLTRKKSDELTNKRVNELTDSSFPTSMPDLLSIPGIGPYTAAAIRNFAFGLPTPCIDTNIRRILHRVFIGPENADGTWERDDKYLLKIASEVLEEVMKKGEEEKEGKEGAHSSLPFLPSSSSLPFLPSSSSLPSSWHAALMDFGSLVQTKRNPKWDICPLTAKNIMKTTPKIWQRQQVSTSNHSAIQSLNSKPSEPGRLVGSVFIPNRIFRGRVVEALRDAEKGMTLADIGRQISVDWTPAEHREWLTGILQKLLTDRLIREKKGRYVLG